MIKILVLIDSATEFSRRFLTGLIRYAHENGPWIFYRLPMYYKMLYGEAGIVERIREWGIDAVIVQWEYHEIKFLEDLDIPVFLQNYEDDADWFSKISGDYMEVGAMAADFFAKKRFKNFAFYGNKNFLWSKGRAEGYRIEVEKLGGNYYYFESEYLTNSQWSRSHIELDEWLSSLPKPVAVFACDDYFALQVAEMCKINNINIPHEISLLGVDNDELICNLSYPSISSIVTDDENIGYVAGKKLHTLIMNKKNIPFRIIKKPIRIEERQSTEKYNISDKYIIQIIEYIEKNFISDISIDQLTQIVPLGRRNLEKKFKEAMGITLYQFILEKKTEHLSYKLLTTRESLLDIAIEAGFNDVRNAYRIFKKNTGYTPLNFRKKFSKVDK
ncbi:DNA-binding transcriptional regulator [Proteiniphilum acetatigenes]|uniref:DNA-binding transcriptional regulator n=1 Tax=Proteiniphilum acetatigenes TaxID=294710 RepID=UPI000368A635|nr:XylR family transcriptional regulator [Proteiniphilum acetatigenes]SFK96786.1 transcriptional regulator, AraC family [Porphyromonadaceae bacterium KH3CP3RA]